MLDILVAAPREIRVGGKSYKVGALKLLELGYLQAWIRGHATRPTVAVLDKLPFFPEAERPRLKEEAYQREQDAWPPSIHSREGVRVLFESLDGQLYFLGVFFRKHNPEIADADIEAIAQAIDEVAFWTFWSIATGADDLDPEAVRATVMGQLGMLESAAAPAEAPTTASSSPTSG